MKLEDFDYHLPEHLIARYPLPERRASRLMVADGAAQRISHHVFADLVDLLSPGDLLVFNNTKVIPARLWGRRETGGRVEILIERILDNDCALAHVKASNRLRPGVVITIAEDVTLEVRDRQDDLFVLARITGPEWLDLLHQHGHMPLPPYLSRDDEAIDAERYQTVYAKQPGAVAAPTAGLHFDEALLAQLAEKGIRQTFLTLHVGAGTFQPVRVSDIRAHKMHSEVIEVPESVCEAVANTKANGGRVVAVGTTCVRALETAARAHGELRPYAGETDIFIYPGFQFRVVDRLITNFHLPQSTLLMLVSAFAGREFILRAYREAVKHAYRFFSYGDAMLLSPARSES
ncbi:MAG: tRNA preQ1(34) S-adenosylmethionine ribosyltransferase-isomerase QueA [Gammaproteobacteria bacterium]|nr:MAG: tRNA preQ1(34) S-adenosylmethionine ribosyltransferase-isomerase QueA [Gammaproteobacteria bacterium]